MKDLTITHPAELPMPNGVDPFSEILPSEIVWMILEKSFDFQPFLPTFRRVNKQFRHVVNEISLRKNDLDKTQLAQARLSQDEEISYLLKHQKDIQEDGLKDASRLFNQLSASAKVTIFDLSTFFARENLIERLNEAMIRVRIYPESKLLNCTGCHLTRLPTNLIMDPQLQSYWSKLEWLSLDNNQLTFLPAEIAQLEQLASINLDFNQLSDIPNEVGQLKNLYFFSCSNNRLVLIPDEFCQLSVHEVDFSFNQLTCLPAAIGHLTELEYLALNHNQIEKIPESLGKLAELEYLELSFNRLSEIPPCIGQLASLRALSLSSNCLETLPEEIGQLSTLKKLFLCRNRLTEKPEVLSQLVSLKVLTLQNNPFNTANAENEGQKKPKLK